MTTHTDTIVVGDGIAGCTAALLLARAGQRVVLLAPGEPADQPAPDAPFDTRCYAIAPGARAVLEAAGAWAHVDPARCGTFASMDVWDAGSGGRIRFEPPPEHDGPMGHIVEHAALAAALRQALETGRAGAPTVIREKLSRLSPAAPRAVTLADGRTLEAGLVVGADGAASSVREALGIEVARHDYEQLAIVCNVETTTRHGNIARQRFLETGPLAFLPLPGEHACSIVWSATRELAEMLVAAPEATFRTRLAEALDGALGTVTRSGPRVAVPLVRQRAARMHAEGAALVGDAAHVVHPLAGQGLNLGLLDAAALAECTGAADGPGWPATAGLGRYARWRRSEALALIAVTDGLERLFRQRAGPLRLLRGAGLRATDTLVPVKRWLAARAMGLDGDLPALARGRPE